MSIDKNYLKSNTVKAFPLAKPRSATSADITSRIFYEQNVSNIIRQLTSLDGFVISGDIDDYGNVIETLKINIFGYYFEISAYEDEINQTPNNIIPPEPEDIINTDKIYVAIRLSDPEPTDGPEGSTVIIPQEIIGQDNAGNYEGLYFGYVLPNDYKGFQLLDSNGVAGDGRKKWKIHEDSRKKFDYTNDLNITFIDGKN